MDLRMEQANKIGKLFNLREEIEDKEKHIEQEKEKLKILQEKYNEELESQLHILLFMIDETNPMSNDEKDLNYEYVYYCPNSDSVRCILEHKKEKLLPNAIDLRKSFVGMGVPEKIFPGKAWDYPEEIKEAIFKIRCETEHFSKYVSSWSELGEHLVNKFNEEDYVKMMKLSPMIESGVKED